MAHKGIIDKNRRELILKDAQVENVLPEYFLESYPKLVAFLHAYYEFENESSITELLNHLYESRDLVSVDTTLLEFIEDELLLGQTFFEGSVDRRSASEFSSVLFRSKGSKYSIQWFFRTFFGEDPVVVYPKENVFLVGVSDIGPQSLKYITDDKLYQTFSILINVGLSSNKWQGLYKLFIHPAGMYLANQVLIESMVQTYVTTPSQVGGDWTWGSTEQAPIVLAPVTAFAEIYATQLILDRYLLSVPTVVEGNNIEATLTAVNGAPTVATINWEIDGALGLDSRIAAKAGTINLTTSPQTFVLSGTTESLSYQGNTLGPVTIFGTGIETNVDTLTVVDAAASWQLIPNTIYPVEGQSLSFTAIGNNVPNGYIYFWIEHGTTVDADFTSPPPLTGSRLKVGIINGVANINLPLAGGDGEDGYETFTAYFSNTNVDFPPNAVANSGTLTILDDNTTPPSYAVSPFAPTSIDEGNSMSFVFSGANLVEGSTIYFGFDESTTAQDADFVSPPPRSGTRLALTVTGGVLSPANYTPTISADAIVDSPDERFQGSLYTANIAGTKLATSGIVTINDTSIPSVPLAFTLDNPATTIYESNLPQNYTIDASGTGANGTTVYWRIVHGTTDAGDFSGATSGSVVISSLTGSFNITALADLTTEGDETFTIQIDTDPGFGSVYDSVVVTIDDTSLTPVVPIDLISGQAIHSLQYTPGDPTTSYAGWRFVSDGTVRISNPAESYISNWYTPTTASIGTEFQIRATLFSGSADFAAGSTALNTWVPVDDAKWYLQTDGAVKQSVLTIEIGINNGATIYDTENFSIYVESVAIGGSVAMPNAPYTVISTSFGLSGSCASGITVSSSGTISANGYGNPLTAYNLPQTWLIVGNASDYEVRWNYIASLPGGGTIETDAGDNVWLNLGTTRTWTLEDSSNTAGNNSMTGLMEIRDVLTQTVQASGTVTLWADQEP